MVTAGSLFRRSARNLVFAAATLAGCYPTGDGPEPDDGRIYFPTAIVASPSGQYLFLANSDFDLRFSAGTVQAFELSKVRAEVAKCLTTVTASCYGAEPRSFLRASVRIGAFAADMTVIPRLDASGTPLPVGQGRLLLPVRGDATLTFIDFDESDSGLLLTCSRTAAPNTFTNTCAPEWRVGREPFNARAIKLGGEPFAVASPSGYTDQGGIATVVHQGSGDVSLFVGVGTDHKPPTAKLAFALNGLSASGTGIAALDFLTPARKDEPLIPRFIVTNRTQPSVQILEYVRDQGAADRGSLTVVDVVSMPTQASGFDTRGVVVDPPNPGETRRTRVFLTSRSPSSIVVGELDGSHRLRFFENVPMPIGPSRITRAVVDEGSGPRTRIVATSFDARSLVIYNPDARHVSSVLPTHRGPYSFAQDPKSPLGFVANFTDSTIQVVDLDPTHPTYQTIVFSIGLPSGPRG